ncbi:hypothetical protein FE251_13990 [Georgenia wutianyii]|uniref:RAMA domain-containing protein n=1 Tax=Georgenia wutianyii TaxID=2585135 RepID=A0ABX5VRT2_9MICO|nr:hypothetical protein [Georgenia wutianyii]QDB80366.1 hypothetical protein FE251_13990 [Georgenia wutianyii]
MPLFEFDAGQLVRAQVGHAVHDPVGPAVLEAVRAQILDILGLPVFPVTWQDDDGSPRLTAMDPSGNVVSIAVLERLDASALVAALGRAGTQRGWIEIAQSYPRGLAAFRRDWNAFRESQPVGTAVAARVHVAAAAIDDDVRGAVDALVGSGVVVHELGVRTMSNGRLFLDVAELSHPVAPLPWLLPSRPVIESLPGPAALAPTTVPTPDTPATPAPATAAPAYEQTPAPAARPAGNGTVPTRPRRREFRTVPHEDLVRISASLGAPTPIVWVDNGRRGEATLSPDGWIVVAGEAFPAPEAAAGAVTGGEVAVDAWAAWRFGEDGPSLREAREELQSVPARPSREGARLSRRELRRRAASE